MVAKTFTPAQPCDDFLSKRESGHVMQYWLLSAVSARLLVTAVGSAVAKEYQGSILPWGKNTISKIILINRASIKIRPKAHGPERWEHEWTVIFYRIGEVLCGVYR